ncbi:MAG: hypothetical protein Q4C77_00970 [Eubacteriales bacterium]|nr:hypothetical protein [Eubacteriales bacterium]
MMVPKVLYRILLAAFGIWAFLAGVAAIMADWLKRRRNRCGNGSRDNGE